MNCNCGNKAFFFEKTTSDGIFRVFKCDVQENKKKGRCDFRRTDKIRDNAAEIVPVQEVAPIVVSKVVSKNVTPKEMYLKVLNNYIKLCKKTTHLPKEYSTNYIANINYILKRLHMPFYFEDTESIQSLETRIHKNVRVPFIVHVNVFPIKLTEYPLELGVPSEVKNIKKRKIKTRVRREKLDFKDFIEKEEKTKSEAVPDNKSECSDSESDLSEDSDDDDNDKTFDVDEYDSEQDGAPDDMGAFSD